ncbi:MAG: carboxypeptidase regulatory-like domain-containing protein [Candidatus Coatesbacteria bacterium]|nr:MAG: carboxypeptidase regulatory-like domain-containing protein [Candidatus Coatesbacteria bacterium]
MQRFLAWITPFAVAAAWGQAEPERYASREYGIYFDVPAAWTLDRKPTDGLVALQDSLGLLRIVVTAQIMPQRRDVREFADKMERNRGLGGKGVVVARWLEDPSVPEAKRKVLEPLVYDDTKQTDEAKRKYEEAKAKRPVDLAEGAADDGTGSIPGESEFMAEITTRLYEAEGEAPTRLVFYVVGGGVGYTVNIAAAGDDFYAALPMASDAITAMKIDRLSGGRYALPDAKALAAAKKGIIMGKVLSNGQPVAGAAVHLYADAATYGQGVPSHRSRSNGYGEYTITQLEAGRYYLLEVYGVSDAGSRVRSVQPITNIDVVEGRIIFVNIEVSPLE